MNSKKTQELINKELINIIEKDIKTIKEFKETLTEKEKKIYNKLLAKFEETEKEIKNRLKEKKETLEEEQEKTLYIIKEIKYIQQLGELLLKESQQEIKPKKKETLITFIIWFLIGALISITYQLISK